MQNLNRLSKRNARNINGGNLFSSKSQTLPDTSYANSMYNQLNHHAFRHFSYQRPSALLRADIHML